MANETTDKQRRKSVRIKEYDYSAPGSYFVTICTQGNSCLFGRVVKHGVELNRAGEIVETWWQRIPERHVAVELDEYVIMPNHLHGIVNILESNKNSERVGADQCVRPAVALPEIIKLFKTMTTNEYIKGVKQGKWPSFDRHLWQRSYYEHVMRKLENINQVREYIRNNPMRWEQK